MAGPGAPFLPLRIARLWELANNLWWTWNPESRELFRKLDLPLWRLTSHNPVKMLRLIEPTRLVEVSQDEAFLKLYDGLLDAMERDLSAARADFQRQHPEFKGRPVAFFSAEFGLHQSLPLYAGGLGILAGDICKEVSDMGLPLAGVGFMYPKGYFHQHMLPDGRQAEVNEEVVRSHIPVECSCSPDGFPCTVALPMDSRIVEASVWRVRAGSTNLYLLDTDVPDNSPQDRQLSAQLYSGDGEWRLRQELVLGIGGVRAVRLLGLDPAVWHANEGHTTFMLLERVREKVSEGSSFEDAVAAVQRSSVFTTHTPVPAGHDAFPLDLITSYLGPYCARYELDLAKVLKLGEHQEPWGASFNMTVLGMRLAGVRNGVSAKHGEVTRKMWQGLWPDTPTERVPITHVTNGVHLRTWVAEELRPLYFRYMSNGWWKEPEDPASWEKVDEIPDEELWDVHTQLRHKLMGFMREQARRHWLESSDITLQAALGGPLLDPDYLTIVFAKRFATYKRPTLLFQDPGRLARLLSDRWRPVQLVFSGKAHPRDTPAKELIQRVYAVARDPQMAGRIAFVEDYDMHAAKFLVHGSDLWLNNPVPPQEASGTSGEKAALNGVPQIGTLDGWWLEGFNGKNGWAVTGMNGSDAEDAAAMYKLLEERVVPLFYQRDGNGVPHGWVQVMKAAIRAAGPAFCGRRMMKEYVERLYSPLAKGC